MYKLLQEMIKLAKEKSSKKPSGKPAVKKFLLIGVLALTAVVVVVFSAVNFVRAKEYDKLSEQVATECESVKSDVSKKSDIIDGSGFDEYCEEIAREQYGYAKPGEYVLYDSSFGN